MNFFIQGGPVMILLAVFSILIMSLIFFCIFSFRKLTIENFLQESENYEKYKNYYPEEIFDSLAYPLKNAIYWLSYAANLSTLSGLLGTVLGIYHTFNDLEKAALNNGLSLFAKGINESITTTVVGLSLAIFALIFYYIFKDKFTRKEAEIILYLKKKSK